MRKDYWNMSFEEFLEVERSGQLVTNHPIFKCNKCNYIGYGRSFNNTVTESTIDRLLIAHDNKKSSALFVCPECKADIEDLFDLEIDKRTKKYLFRV